MGIIQADALQIPLKDQSVHCCITSPPYWGLRDYGVSGQLGLEKTPEEYVEKMVEVFREVARVLRDDGVCFVNLGDSYLDKQLLGMPWKLAFSLQDDGWYLRSDIIWAKPNPMPESVTDRPTKAHEYVFLFSKQPHYFFDQEAVRERTMAVPKACGENSRQFQDRDPKHPSDRKTRALDPNNGQRRMVDHVSEARANGMPHDNPFGNSRNIRTVWKIEDDGLLQWFRWYSEQPEARILFERYADETRNIKNVWNIATQPFPEAHFATFPEELARRCILAGTSEKGVCPKCGGPWVRITKTHGTTGKSFHNHENDAQVGMRVDRRADSHNPNWRVETLGWKPTCTCGEPHPTPATVLDPLSGAGTTALVAQSLHRHSISLELKKEYITMSKSRIYSKTPAML